MAHPEADELELKQAITSTLEAKGVLGTIRAQLRAAVFTAIDEQERKKGIYTPNPRVAAMKDTPEGRLLCELLREFFEFYDMEHTLSVFTPECMVSQDRRSRDELRKDVQLPISSTDKPYPLLHELLMACQQQSGKASVARASPPASSSGSSRSGSPPSPSRGRGLEPLSIDRSTDERDLHRPGGVDLGKTADFTSAIRRERERSKDKLNESSDSIFSMGSAGSPTHSDKGSAPASGVSPQSEEDGSSSPLGSPMCSSGGGGSPMGRGFSSLPKKGAPLRPLGASGGGGMNHSMGGAGALQPLAPLSSSSSSSAPHSLLGNLPSLGNPPGVNASLVSPTGSLGGSPTHASLSGSQDGIGAGPSVSPTGRGGSPRSKSRSLKDADVRQAQEADDRARARQASTIMGADDKAGAGAEESRTKEEEKVAEKAQEDKDDDDDDDYDEYGDDFEDEDDENPKNNNDNDSDSVSDALSVNDEIISIEETSFGESSDFFAQQKNTAGKGNNNNNNSNSSKGPESLSAGGRNTNDSVEHSNQSLLGLSTSMSVSMSMEVDQSVEDSKALDEGYDFVVPVLAMNGGQGQN